MVSRLFVDFGIANRCASRVFEQFILSSERYAPLDFVVL